MKAAFSSDMLSSGVGCYFYIACRTLGVFTASILLGEFIYFIKDLVKKYYFKERDVSHKKETYLKEMVPMAVITLGMICGSVKFYFDNSTSLYAFNLTDENWTNGVSNWDKSVILFSYNDTDYFKLSNAQKLISGNEEYSIVKIENDNVWIHVHVDRDAEGCAYSNKLIIE